MSQYPLARSRAVFPDESARVRAGWRAFWPKVLTAAAFLPVLAGIFMQGPEYDESIMMLTVSGHTHPVWPEVAVSAGEVQGMFGDRTDLATLLSDVRGTDVHPPLHYAAAWAMHLATGPSLTAQRMMSLAALAGCLFLLLYQWRRDAGGDSSSIAIFTLLFMLAPASYFAGSTARGYAFVILFLAAAYVALRWIADDRGSPDGTAVLRASAIVGTGTGLAILTHYLAAVPAATLGGTALVLLLRRRNWRAAAVLCAIAIVPALVSAAFLLNQLDTRGGYDPVAFPGFLSMLGRMPVLLFLQVPNEGMPVPEGVYSLLLTALATAVALFGALVVAVRTRDFAKLGLPGVIIVLHMVGLVLQQWASGAPLSSPRYLAIVWPFAALVLAHGVMWYRRRFRWGMAAPILLVAAYLMQVSLALGSMPGQPFKYIADAATTHTDRAILIVDRGYGRGIPASIALAASPETRLWIVTPDMLEAAPIHVLADRYDAIHVALSIDAPTKGPIMRWLDRLPDRTPYVERDTDILLHRHFIRQPADS